MGSRSIRDVALGDLCASNNSIFDMLSICAVETVFPRGGIGAAEIGRIICKCV
jgi:hypothetical protein